MNDLLNVVDEPSYYEITTHDGIKWVGENRNTLPGHTSVGLYTESQLQAAYRKGAEDALNFAITYVIHGSADESDLNDALVAYFKSKVSAIRALPIKGEHGE